jgi:hypothetical protein
MSRTVPTGARPEWPHEPERSQGYNGEQSVPGSGYGDRRGAPGPEYGGQAYGSARQGNEGYDGRARGDQGYNGQAGGNPRYSGQAPGNPQYNGQPQGNPQYNGQPQGNPQYSGQAQGNSQYNGQPQGDPRYNGQAAEGQLRGGQGNRQPAYDGTGYAAPGYGDQGYADQRYDAQATGNRGYGGGQAYGGQAYDAPGYAPQGYGPERGAPDQPAQQYDGYGDPRRGPARGYQDQPAGQYGQQGNGDPRGYRDTRRGFSPPGGGDGPARPGQRRPDGPTRPGQRKVRFRRTRRFVRRPTVRVIGALFGVFLIWVMFSVGQAAFKNNGQGLSANLAEWARDHYLGPVVTFGEWLSYNPPKTGGKPSISYVVPKGEQVTATKGKGKGFQPDIPATLKPLASGAALPGEGQWRVVEKVKGEPAILTTLLRDGGQYPAYSNGIASIDQRLVKFSLRPGTEDPGAANWGVSNYIPAGSRTGLLATFNGGFKLDSAEGGFYLNGIYHGSLVNGAASVVYYKNGTIKVGKWGRDFTMNSSIVGVRQNLKLLVDHGQLSPDANFAVNSSFGATLGGGAWVWRSGLGITKDGRIVYVYGQALDAKDLALLLQRAGAVEGMQMDINPAWMKFDYYVANGHPSDPTPVPLLPLQQPSPYSYYSPSTRDFTAVYAR